MMKGFWNRLGTILYADLTLGKVCECRYWRPAYAFSGVFRSCLTSGNSDLFGEPFRWRGSSVHGTYWCGWPATRRWNVSSPVAGLGRVTHGNKAGRQGKLYALHAPKVVSIAFGICGDRPRRASAGGQTPPWCGAS